MERTVAVRSGCQSLASSSNAHWAKAVVPQSDAMMIRVWVRIRLPPMPVVYDHRWTVPVTAADGEGWA